MEFCKRNGSVLNVSNILYYVIISIVHWFYLLIYLLLLLLIYTTSLIKYIFISFPLQICNCHFIHSCIIYCMFLIICMTKSNLHYKIYAYLCFCLWSKFKILVCCRISNDSHHHCLTYMIGSSHVLTYNMY